MTEGFNTNNINSKLIQSNVPKMISLQQYCQLETIYEGKIQQILQRYRSQQKQIERLKEQEEQLRRFIQSNSIRNQLCQKIQNLQKTNKQTLKIQTDLQHFTILQNLHKQIEQLKGLLKKQQQLKQKQMVQLRNMNQKIQQKLSIERQRYNELSSRLTQESKRYQQSIELYKESQIQLKKLSLQNDKAIKNMVLQHQQITTNIEKQKEKIAFDLQIEKQLSFKLHQQLQNYKQKQFKKQNQVQQIHNEIQSYKILLAQKAQQSFNKQREFHMKQINGLFQFVQTQVDNRLNIVSSGFQKSLQSLNQEYLQKMKANTKFYEQHIMNMNKINENKQRQIQELKIKHQNIVAKIRNDHNSYALSLQEVIRKIQTIIFNQPYSIIQNTDIVQKIQSRINKLKEKTQLAQSQQKIWKHQYESVQSQFSELKKYFTKLNILFNINYRSDHLLQKLKIIQRQQLKITHSDLFETLKLFINNNIRCFAQKQQEINKIQSQNQTLTTKITYMEKQYSSLERKNQSLLETIAQDKNQLQNLIKRHHCQIQEQSASSTNRFLLLQQQKNVIQRTSQHQQNILIKNKQENTDLKETIKDLKSSFYKEQKNLKRKISQLQTNYAVLSKQKTSLQQLISEKLRDIQLLQNSIDITKNQQQLNLNKLRESLNELYQTSYSQSTTFNDILEGIKKNSQIKLPLTVSPIFQTAYKYKKIIIPYICGFLKLKSFTTNFLYKYDQFNKNFAHYLPTKDTFDYIIIVRSKKQQIFGVVSSGLGKGSKSIAFNLNQNKLFQGDSKLNSSNFDGIYLIFGQGQIRFRVNSNLQVVVNSRIFGTRYFNFKKEQLVGPNQQEGPILLEAMEIHRINN